MSTCLCRKQSAFNQTSTPKPIRLIFGRAFPLVECSTERTRTRKTFEVAHVEVMLKIRKQVVARAATHRRTAGGGRRPTRAANAAHLRQHRERAPARATARDVGGVARGGLRQEPLLQGAVDGRIQERGAPARATRGGGVARHGSGSEPRVDQGVGRIGGVARGGG